MQVKLSVMAVIATMLFAAAVSAQDLVVKIGHVGPISGGLAAAGKENENGARMAIDELNARGVSIGGRTAKFRLIAVDAYTDTAGSTSAQKLVDARVDGVIGHLLSGPSIVASKIYSAAGIPQISASATHPLFTRNGLKTTFRVVADDTRIGTVLARYAVLDLKAVRIALIDDGSPYGQGIAGEFSKALSAAGGNIVETRHMDVNMTDFSTILTAVAAKRADLVFFGGATDQAGQLIQQMKQEGIGARLMGGDAMCLPDLPPRAGGAMADDQVICAKMDGVDKAGRPAMDKFRADFERKFGVEPLIYAPHAYDAVMVMVDAMVRAGSSEPAKYLPALAATRGYKGVTGPISFDSKGDIENAAVTLFTYRGWKQTAIEIVRD